MIQSRYDMFQMMIDWFIQFFRNITLDQVILVDFSAKLMYYKGISITRMNVQ